MPLIIRDLFVDQLSLEATPDYQAGNELRQVQVALKIEHLLSQEDPSAHQLVMVLKMEPGDAESVLPYSLQITGRGVFRIEGAGLSDDERNRLLILNGGSILLGMLRSQIITLTGVGRNGRFVIPAINLIEALEHLERNEGTAASATDTTDAGA
jgi:preprotein translocase subunit SecB